MAWIKPVKTVQLEQSLNIVQKALYLLIPKLLGAITMIISAAETNVPPNSCLRNYCSRFTPSDERGRPETTWGEEHRRKMASPFYCWRNDDN